MNQTRPAASFAKGVGQALLAATLIALMPAAILPAAAQDEEKLVWFGSSYGGTTILAYGIPDSDYVMLYFSCAIDSPTVSVYVQDEESSAEEDALLHVRLSAGGAQVEFSDRAIPNEDSGGKDVEGHLPLDETLRRILTAKGTLEIFVDGHIQHYEMNGASEPAAALLAVCDAPRRAGSIAHD